MSSIRLLLQIAVQYNLLTRHLDVKSAYLNAPLDSKIYIDSPKGCKNENYVWKHGVMVKAMDCGIVVREFVLQSRYYIHFRYTNKICN